MKTLTTLQRAFLARSVIAELMGTLIASNGDTLGNIIEAVPEISVDELTQVLGFAPEEIEAFRMAIADLEKVRSAMEEEAAFKYLVPALIEEHVLLSKKDCQQQARHLIKNAPERFEEAVELSGLYEHLAQAVSVG
jgi:hypothetical protein